MAIRQLHITLTWFGVFTLALVSFSCKTQKNNIDVRPEVIEDVFLDTINISSLDELDSLGGTSKVVPPYQATETRLIDIEHTQLDIAFDWQKQWVLGTATITLKAYNKPINAVTLDAKTFDIHQVTMNGATLKYAYQDNKLTIDLPRYYTKKESLILQIKYTAKPNEGPIGGSSAITSDKGLFFINPLGKEEGKPMQIWTQGETENNSQWFPTFDKPNERFTQVINITVDKKFSTLSNGTKTKSVVNADGSRTDTWTQTKPHAPYLAMMAVGDFAWVEDKWNNLPLYYIVEPAYKEDAKAIFNHTPEMLDFFSKTFQYPFVWDKYAQVVVKDFVSGAMENTTAVTFGDFVQKTKREMIDDHNDYIVAHEMCHHWFGDLVTCESWSNLTLNEGFANYAEYLWFEHKYGKDEADNHRINELNGYLSSVYGGQVHPLIHYHFDNREEMFDAHSYNKGGMVLHMLRTYLGDETFFASLSKYLHDNQYSTVEADQLRIAFEAVSGEDLNWFFDQWYFREGHPDFEVSYAYDGVTQVQTVFVEQMNAKPFIMPLDVMVIDASGKVSYHPILIKNKKDTFYIGNVLAKPASVVFDGRDIALATINEKKSSDEWLAQFRHSPNLVDKVRAFYNIEETDQNHQTLLVEGLSAKFHLLRSTAIDILQPSTIDAKIRATLVSLAKNDPHSMVRQVALSKLVEANTDNTQILDICKHILTTDSSYVVISKALNEMAQIDDKMAVSYAAKFSNDNSSHLLSGLASVYSNDTTAVHIDWFKNKILQSSPNFTQELMIHYLRYISGLGFDKIIDRCRFLQTVALSPSADIYKKYFATASLASYKANFELLYNENGQPEAKTIAEDLQKLVNEIKAKETNPDLLARYSEL